MKLKWTRQRQNCSFPYRYKAGNYIIKRHGDDWIIEYTGKEFASFGYYRTLTQAKNRCEKHYQSQINERELNEVS